MEGVTQSTTNAMCSSLVNTIKTVANILLNPLNSAVFGALGPLFNKQVVVSAEPTEDKILSYVMKYSLYPIAAQITLNIVFILLMLTVNTMSVKYKMLSFKYSGSFVSTAVIFSVSSFLSLIFDLIISWVKGEGIPTNLPKQLIALLMICVGVTMIAGQSSHTKQDPTPIDGEAQPHGEALPTEQGRISGVFAQPSERSAPSTQIDPKEEHSAAQTLEGTVRSKKLRSCDSKAAGVTSVEDKFWANKTLDPYTDPNFDFELSILHKSAGDLRRIVRQFDEALPRFNDKEVELKDAKNVTTFENPISEGTFEA